MVCDGVEVKPADGVAVVPRAQAEKVLVLAQEMDLKEHSMYSYIEKLKSIEEAVKEFGRLWGQEPGRLRQLEIALDLRKGTVV